MIFTREHGNDVSPIICGLYRNVVLWGRHATTGLARWIAQVSVLDGSDHPGINEAEQRGLEAVIILSNLYISYKYDL